MKVCLGMCELGGRLFALVRMPLECQLARMHACTCAFAYVLHTCGIEKDYHDHDQLNICSFMCPNMPFKHYVKLHLLPCADLIT